MNKTLFPVGFTFTACAILGLGESTALALRYKYEKGSSLSTRALNMAGVERFELPTRGFGIRCSANWSYTPVETTVYHIVDSKKPRESEVFEISGGADGTRTRDPRRDRPVF